MFLPLSLHQVLATEYIHVKKRCIDGIESIGKIENVKYLNYIASRGFQSSLQLGRPQNM